MSSFPLKEWFLNIEWNTAEITIVCIMFLFLYKLNNNFLFFSHLYRKKNTTSLDADFRIFYNEYAVINIVLVAKTDTLTACHQYYLSNLIKKIGGYTNETRMERFCRRQMGKRNQR